METTSVPVEETWRLEDLFESEDHFRDALRATRGRLPELDRWEGRLGECAVTLADALEASAEVYKEFARLRCYASLRSDCDTRIASNHALRQEVDLLGTDLSGRVSYLRPEILALEPAALEEFLATEPRLEPHGFFLRDLIRQREHVLGPAEERILAEAGLVTRSAESLYQVLHNVDLPRPEVELTSGETVKLTPVAFNKHRTSPLREDRLRVFPAYYGAYAAFRDTMGENLYGAVRAHMFRARTRRYDGSLSAALDGDNVPTRVYTNLIQHVSKGLPLIHRYYRLRARALGLERLEYADLYCPISTSTAPQFTPEEARRLVLESVAPIGERYCSALERAYDERWIDWHPTAGKRSGAYATGWAYDVHPYVLLNYTGELDGVSTLAHEMGHAMHSFFSNGAQPFARADYSIFVAEVASTVNEALLSSHLVGRVRSVDEELFLLGSYLDGIRGTLFRQTMFADFELEIHERAQRGEALTGERFSEIYLALLRRYQGHHDGVMAVDERYSVEWAAIPHFYFDFYVYQYATGIVAATALSEKLASGEDGAAERYLEFLSSGGSDDPLELLRRAGVDLEDAAPYEATFVAMRRRLDRLESLIDTTRSDTGR